MDAAFPPATDKAYKSTFGLFMPFMESGIQKVNIDFLLIYLEFLVLNSATPGQLANRIFA